MVLAEPVPACNGCVVRDGAADRKSDMGEAAWVGMSAGLENFT